jgi:hypothetical protein
MTLTTGEATTGGTAAEPDLATPAAVPGGTASAALGGAVTAGATVPATGPSIARALVMGTLAGFVFVVALVTGVGILSDLEPMGALGLGVFIGMWGGAGFGFMTAGALSLARHTDAEHAAAAAHP